MNIRTIIILALLLLAGLAEAQQKNVATFGNITISAEEFKNRFDLTPRLGASDYLVDSLKMEFLSTLLAEKLWAAEAVRRGVDTLEIIKNAMAPIEKLLVKDALYKLEVEDKIVISQKELRQAENRSNAACLVKILSTPDSTTAFAWYKQLQKGKKFTVLQKENGDTATAKVVLGTFKKQYPEDMVYALNPGEYSIPVKDGQGWFLFYVTGREVVEKKKDHMTEPGRAPGEIIRQRKAEDIGMPFLRAMLKDLKIKMDREALQAAADAIAPVFAMQKANNKKNPNGEYCIDETNLLELLRAVQPNILQKHIIQFAQNPITLEQFLHDLAGKGFCSKKTTADELFGVIHGELNRYVEAEVLSREGYRRGLQHSPEVQKDLALWKQNYCAQFLRNRYVDSVTVTEDDIAALYDSLYRKNSSTVIKIAEIFSSQLSVMQEALDRLAQGEEFGAVAAKLTERSGMREKRGEWNAMPVSLMGETGQIAAGMQQGEVKGPVKVQAGYAIIKVLEKTDKKDSTAEFASLKNLLQQAAAQKKLYSKFFEATKNLARSYQPQIDTQVLKEIPVSPVPMYTVRLIGFGGRMLAYPYSTPWENWVPKYLQNRDMP